MTDNLSVFWQNNERARALFYELLDRAQREEYDDDFLARLAAYREAGGDAAHADIFAAQYLFYEGDAETALVCAERAYRRRPVNYEVWKLLAEVYTRQGRTTDALTMPTDCISPPNSPPTSCDAPVRRGSTAFPSRSASAILPRWSRCVQQERKRV